jgi:putative ABC transport system substrate-binding protein
VIGRREFIAGLGGAAAWPIVARAQQAKVPVIGYLNAGSQEEQRGLLAAFLKGLAESGYVEGRNVTIEYRWADRRYDQVPNLTSELVSRRVDAIATSATATALAAQAATTEIPIVFMVASDPVEIGLVASLNRPGGNLTGVAVLAGELTAKRLEVLRETVPSAKLIAFLTNPGNRALAEAETRKAEAAARVLGLNLLPLSATTPSEIDGAFQQLTQQRVDGLLVSADGFLNVDQGGHIVALAARHRVPTIYDRREEVATGGLIGYGADVADAVRLTGVYAGRILSVCPRTY